jgi:hypothetical protein
MLNCKTIERESCDNMNTVCVTKKYKKVTISLAKKKKKIHPL